MVTPEEVGDVALFAALDAEQCERISRDLKDAGEAP
jgi:hypothetical protein